ncbi:MAG: hypothetical protein A2452_02225 [Candidatus Firestonebacteria bacterium RIFOXYC2_FULL_39_67]|nr:MAG: hypothetical protein A2452_02225 [Candidatus Firestonebacteria bacterium RIFOXYC2_FULL_39_67]
MKNEKLSFSICIPIYKGSNLLKMSLDSIFRQEFNSDFEVIIGDNTPLEFKDELEKVESILKSYDNKKIKYIQNKVNLGYAVNLQNIVKQAAGDVLFLMAHDDILSKDSLQKTHDAFFLGDDIGCVTRPYYWFTEDFKKPVRAVTPYSEKEDSVISVRDKRQFMKIFESVGQLSGLAYKRELITVPFNEECFPAHIYPFAGILKKHKCVFLKDYTVAVGIMESQTRSISTIYDLSPTESWLKMYRTVFVGDEFQEQRNWGIEHICKNYMGFVQLKNHAKSGVLWKEIKILIKERPKNLLNLKFWFYTLGTILTPRFILRKLVDLYKEKVVSKGLNNIRFNY